MRTDTHPVLLLSFFLFLFPYACTSSLSTQRLLLFTSIHHVLCNSDLCGWFSLYTVLFVVLFVA